MLSGRDVTVFKSVGVGAQAVTTSIAAVERAVECRCAPILSIITKGMANSRHRGSGQLEPSKMSFCVLEKSLCVLKKPLYI